MWASAAEVVAGGPERRRGSPGASRGVDARRRQEHLAERRQRVLGLRADRVGRRLASPSVSDELLLVRPGEVEVPLGDQRADQRVAVRVEPGRRRGRRSRRRRARPCRRGRSSRSTTPTQNPARSNSPGSIRPGCSAVSPPTSAQPASRQPSATPPTSSRDAAPGRGGRRRRSRGRTAARRRCRRRRRRTSRRGRRRSCRSGRAAAAIAVFVPTPSVDDTSTGSR